MASITTSIELVDRVSDRLAAIEAGAAALSGTLGQLGKAVDGVSASLAGMLGMAGMTGMDGFEYLPEGGALEIEARIVPQLDIAALEDKGGDIAAQLQAMLDSAAAAWQGERMQALGRQVPEHIAAGMDAGAGTLTAQADQLSAGCVQAAQEAMSVSAGRSIGLNFSGGLAAGIRAGRSGVVNAARAVANAAASAARAALDIHSPSRVMEEAGGYFGEGFSIGIEDSALAVQRAAARLACCAQAAAEQAASGEEIGRGARLIGSHGQLDDGESLRRVREAAQEGGVNRLTTAQVHVDFTANNQISSEMDLDEVVAYLERQLTERLAMAAEGVYG